MISEMHEGAAILPEKLDSMLQDIEIERAHAEAGAPKPQGATLKGRSILLLHNREFVGGYIRTVLIGAGATVTEATTLGDGHKMLSAASAMDAAALDLELSGADDHALADELDRRRLPYLYFHGLPCASRPTTVRNRPSFSWPFAGYQICETLAALLTSD